MEQQKISYFGLGKSNTYLALVEYLLDQGYQKVDDYNFKNVEKEIELIGTYDFDKLAKLVDQREVDFAVLPFANSDSGIITGTYELMINKKYELVNMFQNEIKLKLYCLKDSHLDKDLKQIKTIYTNVPVLNQCSNFINKYMPFAVYKYAASTTDSIAKLIEFQDKDGVCIANETADDNDEIKPVSNNIVSNNGGSITRFIMVKKRKPEITTFDEVNINNNFIGYYLYVSTNDKNSQHSVNAKSWRVVRIRENGDKRLEMTGFTVGYKTVPLFHSVDTCAFINRNGEACLFYEYSNSHTENTVNGFAKLNASDFAIENNENILGTYCGYANNKTGTLSYIKIKESEYKIYMGLRYGE